MATVLELERRGDLDRLDPQLDPDEQEHRVIFIVREVVASLPKLLETMVAKLAKHQSPAAQLDDIVYHFCSGGTLVHPRHFHEIRFGGDGFWELRTPDLRLFGFFHKVDCFICTDVADKNFIAERGSTSGYVTQGKFRRQKLDLNEPKWITGVEAEDVVSNCYRAK